MHGIDRLHRQRIYCTVMFYVVMRRIYSKISAVGEELNVMCFPFGSFILYIDTGVFTHGKTRDDICGIGQGITLEIIAVSVLRNLVYMFNGKPGS